VGKMSFKNGDIIEYCNEYYEVETNYGSSGTVWEVNDKFERTGVRIQNFYWSAYGVDCTLIKEA
jgi:hypothetical protein